jgi:hypothetical protein
MPRTVSVDFDSSAARVRRASGFSFPGRDGSPRTVSRRAVARPFVVPPHEFSTSPVAHIVHRREPAGKLISTEADARLFTAVNN